MNTRHPNWSILVAVALLAPAAVSAEQPVTNRLTFSALFGLNISARFMSPGGGAGPGTPRMTPDGDTYNYDDGYVLTDVSGNFGGQTWYWGYDDSARQISGNTILLSRSTSAAGPSQSSDSDPDYGAELAFSHPLGARGNLRYGFEIAVNHLNLALHDDTGVSRITDAYPFTPGTTPPTAVPSDPYQGSFNGPGFIIGDTPVSSTTTTDRQRFASDIWGFRLGPYLELPIGERVNLWAGGGFAWTLMNNSVTWANTGGSGSSGDLGLLWGGYLSANASWQFSEHWNLVAGVQYQKLGTYRHTFSGRPVEVDFNNALLVTLGFGCSF